MDTSFRNKVWLCGKTYLSQDRIQWRLLVNTLMKIRVSQKAGYDLKSLNHGVVTCDLGYLYLFFMYLQRTVQYRSSK